MFIKPSTTSRSQAPGPRGLQLFHTLSAMRQDLLTTLLRCQREYGDLLRFSLGTKIVHVLCHPAMAERVLIQDLETFGSVVVVMVSNGFNSRSPKRSFVRDPDKATLWTPEPLPL